MKFLTASSEYLGYRQHASSFMRSPPLRSLLLCNKNHGCAVIFVITHNAVSHEHDFDMRSGHASLCTTYLRHAGPMFVSSGVLGAQMVLLRLVPLSLLETGK